MERTFATHQPAKTMCHQRTTCFVLALLIAAIALTGCPERGARVELEGEIDAPEELIGTWLLVEQDGFAPLTLWTITFTTTGDYIVQSETRALDYQHYFLTGENLIAVTDEIGADPTYYEFDVSDDVLRLWMPDTDVRAVLERRDDLLEARPEMVPPVPVDPHPDEVQEQPAPEPQPDEAQVGDPPRN